MQQRTIPIHAYKMKAKVQLRQGGTVTVPSHVPLIQLYARAQARRE